MTLRLVKTVEDARPLLVERTEDGLIAAPSKPGLAVNDTDTRRRDPLHEQQEVGWNPAPPAKSIAFVPHYTHAYQPGTRCPSCSGKAWHIGRLLAECARCGFAAVLGQK